MSSTFTEKVNYRPDLKEVVTNLRTKLNRKNTVNILAAGTLTLGALSGCARPVSGEHPSEDIIPEQSHTISMDTPTPAINLQFQKSSSEIESVDPTVYIAATVQGTYRESSERVVVDVTYELPTDDFGKKLNQVSVLDKPDVNSAHETIIPLREMPHLAALALGEAYPNNNSGGNILLIDSNGKQKKGGKYYAVMINGIKGIQAKVFYVASYFIRTAKYLKQ